MAQTKEEKAAAKAAKDAEKAAAKAAKDASEAVEGIEVGDPQLLRPVELPLVVKPTSGEWENEAQARHAKVLNAYAYRNPAKWEKKKGKLIKQLAQLGENPEYLNVLNGGEDLGNGKIAYTDKRLA